MLLTKEREGGYARELDFRHRARDRLAHVNEAVFDKFLGEDIAVEVQRMFTQRRLQFRYVMQRGRWREGAHVRP